MPAPSQFRMARSKMPNDQSNKHSRKEPPMFEPSHANEGIQMLVPQRRLDVAARLIGETGGSNRPSTRRDDPPGIPFGYTNSLEDLIKEGRQFGTIYAEPPWPSDLA